MSLRRLYRVTAIYADRKTTRHYQSKDAAEHRAAVCRQGYFEVDGHHHGAASLVTIDVSNPVTWPTS